MCIRDRCNNDFASRLTLIRDRGLHGDGPLKCEHLRIPQVDICVTKELIAAETFAIQYLKRDLVVLRLLEGEGFVEDYITAGIVLHLRLKFLIANDDFDIGVQLVPDKPPPWS